MKLHQLLASIDAKSIRSSADPETEIVGITDDSRKAAPGVIFCATDQGSAFLDQAQTAGSLLLVPSTLARPGALVSADVAHAMGHLASALYGHPSDSMLLAGITGTNGKTSTTWMIYHLWKSAGIPCGLIGTLGLRISAGGREWEEKTGYTTPRSYQIQAILSRMLEAGVRRVAMEVSSEALALGRLHGLRFTACAFTNLTRDHLDFHRTMDEYFESKALLFYQTAEAGGRLISFLPETGDEESQGYAKRMADLAKTLFPTAEILSKPLAVNLAAGFQKINAAIAVETAGIDAGERARFAALVETLPPVPGRFEPISLSAVAGHPESFAAVDYAHSPDALRAILEEARAGAGEVITVCGCGGNRDPGKRPLMGRIGSELSDVLILTDDNPRKEEPAEIRRQMKAGIPTDTRCDVREIGDRRQAIREAVGIARSRTTKTIVVIAGKGHETQQILSDRTEAFSDREEVLKALAEVEARK